VEASAEESEEESKRSEEGDEEEEHGSSDEEEADQDDQEATTLLNATQFGQKSFKELNVSPWLVANLDAVGIKRPTLIQEETLMHSLKPHGNHIIGCAHTGSGKTACFAIPIL